MTLGENIRALRRREGWSTYQLADQAGVKQSSVQRIEQGKTRPRPETLSRIAKALKTEVPQLEYGISGSDVLPLGTIRVPMLDYVQAGCWTGVASQPDDWPLEHTHLVTADHSPDSFAMMVRGESMSPSLKEGDIVIVSPDVRPHPGDIVVAVDEQGDASVKQFRSIGLNASGQDVFELKSVNELYPSMRSDVTQIRIIGTVVAFERRLRVGK